MIRFFINGKQVTVTEWDKSSTLVEYIRYMQHLTGTKVGCQQGGCGACSVVLQKYDNQLERIVHRSINSCLTPLCSVDGCHIITVEGIGSCKKLHTIQDRFIETHASQCGFCTPGFVVSTYAALRENPKITMREIEEALDGNLCRCTGYRPILDAAKTLASDYNKGTGCCKGEGSSCPCKNPESTEDSEFVSTNTFDKNLPKFQEYKPESELIFPPALKTYKSTNQVLTAHDSSGTWYQPTTIDELTGFMESVNDPHQIIFYYGNLNFTRKLRESKEFISLLKVDGLDKIKIEENQLVIGSATTLATVQEYLSKFSKENVNIQLINALNFQIKKFGTPQLRNFAGIGSTIINTDMTTSLLTLLTEIEILIINQEKKFERKRVTLKEFIAHRKPSDKFVVLEVRIPLNDEKMEYIEAYKEGISLDNIISSCLRVQVDEELTIKNLIINITHYGFLLNDFSIQLFVEFLLGKKWTKENVEAGIFNEFLKEYENQPNRTDTYDYKRAVAAGFVYRFFINSSHHFSAILNKPELVASLDSVASVANFERSYSTGEQNFEIVKRQGIQSTTPVMHAEVSPESCKRAPVGLPIVHIASPAQCCGETQFVDDVRSPPGCYYAAHIYSKHPSAKILSVDAAEALAIEGVHGYYDWNNIKAFSPAYNNDKERIFVDQVARCYGEVIGVIVADTHQLAVEAAELVKVEYEVLKPVLTINDAILSNTFYAYNNRLTEGDPDHYFSHVPEGGKIIEGEMNIGGQEHFYMEPHAILVCPGELGEMTVYSCTQCVHKTTKIVASAIGVSANKVYVKVKRIGGGFGGKETYSTYTAARLAVPSADLRRPVRILVNRNEDMQISGYREIFYVKYSAVVVPVIENGE